MRKWVIAAIVVLLAWLFLGNSPWVHEPGRPFLLAHRGLAQTFDLAGVQADTCTATRIHPPTVPFLENTVPSLRAAFAAGADAAEIDVQVTGDRQLAVFHDATLDCRTDGHGPIAGQTMAALRKLDVGFGYTADSGLTHPFRGKGIGLMPTVPEMLAAFPDRELKLDLKRDSSADGRLLADFLATLPPARLPSLTVTGGDQAVAAVLARFPTIRASSRQIIKKCLVEYAGSGWTGHLPDSCHHRELPLPERYGRWLWGWPNRFVARMRAADTRVVLVRGEGDWSAGFDTVDDLAELPAGWTGGIWTNRVDIIAPRIG